MRKQYDVRLVQKVEDLVVRKMLKSRNGREASLEYTGKNKVLVCSSNASDLQYVK